MSQSNSNQLVLDQANAVMRVGRDLYFDHDLEDLSSRLKLYWCLNDDSLMLSSISRYLKIEQADIGKKNELNEKNIRFFMMVKKIQAFLSQQPIHLSDNMSKLLAQMWKEQDCAHKTKKEHTAQSLLQLFEEFLRVESFLSSRFSHMGHLNHKGDDSSVDTASFMEAVDKQIDHVIFTKH